MLWNQTLSGIRTVKVLVLTLPNSANCVVWMQAAMVLAGKRVHPLLRFQCSLQ
jgi:hypothetical protein